MGGITTTTFSRALSTNTPLLDFHRALRAIADYHRHQRNDQPHGINDPGCQFGAPCGLTANAGDAQVSLSWPASVGASGYHVKRAKVNSGPYETFACPSGTSVVDSGLVNGTTYYYTVSAAYTGGPDAGGESANSVQVSATPQGGTPTPPGPPTALNTRSNRPGTINLQWFSPPLPE